MTKRNRKGAAGLWWTCQWCTIGVLTEPLQLLWAVFITFWKKQNSSRASNKKFPRHYCANFGSQWCHQCKKAALFVVCVPVEEEVSLLIGAATQRLTDDVTVPERMRTSGEKHRYRWRALFYDMLCSIKHNGKKSSLYCATTKHNILCNNASYVLYKMC